MPFPVNSIEEQSNLLMVTKQGIVKKTPFSEYLNIRQNGLIAIAIREGDELMSVMRTFGDDDIIIGTHQGMSIRFNENDVRPMGRVAMGVRAIQLRPGDEVVDAAKINDDMDVLAISENGYGKRTPATEYKVQNRGGIGIKTLNITEKTGNMCGLKVVDGREDIMMISDANVIIRMNVSEISVFGRSTQGVRVMRLDDESKVVCVAKLPVEEMSEEENQE